MGDNLYEPGACAVEVHERMAGMVVRRLARVLVVCVCAQGLALAGMLGLSLSSVKCPCSTDKRGSL